MTFNWQAVHAMAFDGGCLNCLRRCGNIAALALQLVPWPIQSLPLRFPRSIVVYSLFETQVLRLFIKSPLYVKPVAQFISPSILLALFQNIVIEGGRTGGRVFLVDFGGVQDAVTDKPSSTIVGTYGYGCLSCLFFVFCVSSFPCTADRSSAGAALL